MIFIVKASQSSPSLDVIIGHEISTINCTRAIPVDKPVGDQVENREDATNRAFMTPFLPKSSICFWRMSTDTSTAAATRGLFSAQYTVLATREQDQN